MSSTREFIRSSGFGNQKLLATNVARWLPFTNPLLLINSLMYNSKIVLLIISLFEMQRTNEIKEHFKFVKTIKAGNVWTEL